MKRTVLSTLILFSCLVPSGRAQTVTGSGTVGTLPIFTGSSTIGDSAILQLGGSTAIGATAERMGTKFEVITDSTTPPFPVPGQGPDAIYGEATGDADFTSAIFGLASGTNVISNGVVGVSYKGTGVNGNGGQNGVVGQTNSTNTFAVGVFGVSTATTGGGSVGVFGQAFSPGGTAGQFANVAGGDIIVGGVGQPIVKLFRVDGHGTVFADGGFRPFGADFAESLAVKGSREHYAPGDLLVIDPSGERRLSLAETPYSTLVAGIYSTQPGVVASQHRVAEVLPNDEVPLAVVGVVPCKVTVENGPIMAGDLLVTSSNPGHAMKGTDRSRMLGAVVGKALEPLSKGIGVIQVLVTLQ